MKIKYPIIALLAISCSEKEKSVNYTVSEGGEYLFDTLALGDTITHHFYIKNTENSELVLGNMATVCSCTAITTEGKPINPQDSTKITVNLVGEKRDIGLLTN